MPTLEALLGRDLAFARAALLRHRNREEAVRADDLLALKDRYMERLALHFIMSEEPQEIEWLNGRSMHRRSRCSRASSSIRKRAQVSRLRPGQHERGSVARALGKLGVDAAHIHCGSLSRRCAAEHRRLKRQPPRARRRNEPKSTVIMDGRRRTFTMRTDTDTVLDAAAEPASTCRSPARPACAPPAAPSS